MKEKSTVVHITSPEEERRAFEIMKYKWTHNDGPGSTDYGKGNFGMNLNDKNGELRFTWCNIEFYEREPYEYEIISFEEFLSRFEDRPKLTNNQLRAGMTKKWIELNNAKVGDRVKIVSVRNQNADHFYVSGMDRLIGEEGVITCIEKDSDWIQVSAGGTILWYAYYCLEKVEGEKTYSVGQKFSVTVPSGETYDAMLCRVHTGAITTHLHIIFMNGEYLGRSWNSGVIFEGDKKKIPQETFLKVCSTLENVKPL